MVRLSRSASAQFLTENGLPIAATTLAKKAVQGSGPPYQVWNGRATYDVDDLMKWAAQSFAIPRNAGERDFKHFSPGQDLRANRAEKLVPIPGRTNCYLECVNAAVDYALRSPAENRFVWVPDTSGLR
jgi:hypothetical protein